MKALSTIKLFLIINCLAVCYNTKGQRLGNSWDNISFDTIPKFYYQTQELDTFLTINTKMPKWLDLMGVSAVGHYSIFVDSFNFIPTAWPKVDVNYGPGTIPENKKKGIRIFFENETRDVIGRTYWLWLPAIKDQRVLKKAITLRVVFSPEVHSKEEIERYKPLKNLDDELKIMSELTIKKQKSNYDWGLRKLEQGKVLMAEVYFRKAFLENPSDNDAIVNSGFCHLQLQDSTGACYLWEKAKKNGDTGTDPLLRKHNCERIIKEHKTYLERVVREFKEEKEKEKFTNKYLGDPFKIR